MTSPLYNPGQPYLLEIPGGFYAGRVAHLTGVFSYNAANLVLKFQSGPYGDPNDDVGLCLYGRLNDNILGMNSFSRSAGWGQEIPIPNQGFVKGQQFELAILCDPNCFKVAVNQQHMGELPHRLNPASLSHLNIVSGQNDVTINCLWVEDTAAPQQQQQAPYAPPMGAPGAPYAPVQQHSYAPQNAGYQPPPPPGGKSKGLMGMVGSAGAAVAGALGASHLLGKSKGYSSPGGYPGAQPQYGGYPAAQPQYGGYPGAQPQYGGYPGAQPQYGGYPPGGHKGGGGGLLNKAMGLGGGLLGAKAMSKGFGGIGGSKAMKYGLPLAGLGAGGYMLSKGIGKSFSFDGSGSDSDCCDSD